MKKVIITMFCLFGLAASAQQLIDPKAGKKMNQPNLYQQPLTIEDISGGTFDLKSLKGKKVMIVNTASKCGLTPQYEQLEELYQKYKGSGFVIIGFPANNFASQEPGTNKDIAE